MKIYPATCLLNVHQDEASPSFLFFILSLSLTRLAVSFGEIYMWYKLRQQCEMQPVFFHNSAFVRGLYIV